MEGSKIRYIRPSGLSGVELLFCRDAGFDFPRHFHQAYCIWFNAGGAEHYSQAGNTDILQPGEFGIVAPGEVHANRALDRSDRRLMTFYVHPGQLQSVARQIGGESAPAVEFRSRFYRDPECLQSLVNLFACLRDSAAVLEKESAFVEIFSLLALRHATEKLPQTPIGDERARVRSIIELFRARLAETITLDELARRFDCTPFHLIRFFKKASGLSPYAYLLRLRLERARELILQGRPLSDAALASGFADQSHLTRRFKSLYGIPPGEYRRQSLGH